MDTPNSANAIEDLIQQTSVRWTHCEGTDFPEVLKLGVLRDFTRSLHGLKSVFLARGDRTKAATIHKIEEAVEALRNAGPLDAPFPALIGEQKPRLKKKSRLLPEAIFRFVEREKLERFDRVWEAAVLSEAMRTEWRLWTLEAWIELEAAETWHRGLEERIWPHGIVLFVDSLGLDVNARAGGSIWKGRWWVTMAPKPASPEQLSLELDRISGYLDLPEKPAWRSVYSAAR